MSFSELEGWDPMKEAYLASQGISNKRNMYNRQGPRRNISSDSTVSANLYVKRIPKDIDEVAFVNHFSRCGKVIRRYINRTTESPYTYGFVEYSSIEEAQKAMAQLNGIAPFQFELNYARKRKDDRTGRNPPPDLGDIFNPPLTPAGLATENTKQTADILKVTTSNKGRDVQWNSSHSRVSPVQTSATSLNNSNSNNDDKDDWPNESKVHQNYLNGQSISPTPVSNQLHNYTNSVQNYLQPSPSRSHVQNQQSVPLRSPAESQHPLLSRSPVQSHQFSLPSGVVSQNRNSTSEFLETDFSSMPFLSSYAPLCFACDGKGILCCSACRMPYCSPECQRTDWPYHKNKCATLAPHLDRIKYQQNVNVVEKIMEISPPQVNATKKTDAATPSIVTATKNKKTDGMNKTKTDENLKPSCVKKPGEACLQNNNAGKKLRESYNRPSSRIGQGGIFRGKDKNRNKSESTANKGKNIDADVVKSDSHSIKHPTERKLVIQSCESRLQPVDLQEVTKWNASHLTDVTLSISRNEEVDVSFSLGPEKFWVQKASNRQTLQEIAADLVSLNGSKILLPSPAIGDICAAYYSEDNSLYRARITEIKNNMYSVYYFDYGNTEAVQASSLYNLNEKLITYPYQAVCCKLGGVKPPNSSNEWRDLDTTAFKETLAISSAWEARVIKGDSDKCEIDLVSSGISLAALLVENKNAVYIEEELAHPQLKVVHQPAVVDNVNKYVLKVPSAFDQLKVGSTLTLIQVYQHADGIYVHIKNDTDLALFGEMQLSLSLAASKLKNIFSSVQKCEFAVALSPEFGTWNRCYVIDKRDQKCMVRYIDYGNEEEVSNLCQLVSPHLDMCSPLLYCDFSHLPLSEKECAKQLFEFSGVVRKSEDGLMFDVLTNEVCVCSVKLLPWWQGLSCNTLYSEKPIILDIDELELPVAGKTTVKVVWINNLDNQIYVQKVSLENKIENLERDLNDYCNSENHSWIPSVGEMVCAMFVDNKWYRSCVKEIISPDECHVFFVDYGNDETVKFENIRKLPERYSSPSSFCTCVSLCGLQCMTAEISVIIYDGIWELEVIDPSLEPIAVKLLRGSKDLLDILSTQKLLLPQVKSNSNNKCNSNLVKSNCTKKKFLVKDLNEFLSSPVKVVFVDGDYCAHLHIVSDSPKLARMQTQLNNYMQKDQSSSKYSPSVDDIVCAVFSEDNAWYRGIVTEVVGVDHCKVLFVDFGNPGLVSFKEVRPLPEEFASIPIFSLRVLLHGVPVEFMNHRVQPLLEKKYKLVVADKTSEPIQVELFLNERSVNQDLVNHFAPCAEKLTSSSVTLVSEKPEKDKVNQISSLSRSSLPLHKNAEVIFCYGESADTLFVHHLDDRKAVADLFEALQVHCCCKDLPEYTPSNDEVIAAKSDDGMWYRGHVVDSSPETYSVKFIDYGNVEPIPKNLIRFLPSKFASQPIYSICVKLINAESLLATLNFVKTYCVQVHDCVNGQYILEIDNENSKSCNEGQTKDLQVKSANSEVKCSSTESSDINPGYNDVPAIDIPTGSNVDLYIYSIFNPLLIFCSPYDEKAKKKFLDFSSEVTAYCRQVKKCHTPVLDETVFAKHPDDGNWQRAVILEILEDDYQVLFIDSGVIHCVEKEFFKKMDKKFMNFPQQSMACKLGGMLINDENMDRIYKELIDVVKTPCRVRDAHVALVDEEYILDLPSFRKLLIEKGFFS